MPMIQTGILPFLELVVITEKKTFVKYTGVSIYVEQYQKKSWVYCTRPKDLTHRCCIVLLLELDSSVAHGL